MNIYDAYRADLQTQQEFTLEVKRWKTRWVLYPRPCKTKPSLRDIGTRQKKINYIRISPSTATAERSFSLLKRVKTYVRVTL